MTLVCCVHCGDLLDESVGEHCDCALNPCALTPEEEREIESGRDADGALSEGSHFHRVVSLAVELAIRSGRDLKGCLQEVLRAEKGQPS